MAESDTSCKEWLRILAEQAVQQVAADDHSLEYFRDAVAMLDPERDRVVEQLPAFEDAHTALGALQVVQERYGHSEWLALQFVFGFLGNLSEPTFDLSVFETTWEAFWEELSEPEWTWLGLANLLNFRSEAMLLDLGGGITIRGRSFEQLAAMGWSEDRLERISREWLEGNVNSSHVILAEHKLPRTPDTFVPSDSTVFEKVVRALLALRLFKEGDIGIGRMWLLRPASFPLSSGGSTAMGYLASGMPGSPYTLDESELPSVRDLYSKLLRYEGVREEAPVNLGLAFRSFSDIYERRDQRRVDTRLVDAITAVEALLGPAMGTEVTFRLAFRAAMILGKNDDERVHVFTRMKSYYDTRSSVVHGGSRLYKKNGRLRDKPREDLENQQALRDFVRRLLVCFVNLRLASENQFDRTVFDNDTRLDGTLLHNERRRALRKAMGLGEDDS
jgi:hypothetical protein